MATKEERTTMFKSLHLSDQKIQETIKNEPLSAMLVEIITLVSFIREGSAQS